MWVEVAGRWESADEEPARGHRGDAADDEGHAECDVRPPAAADAVDVPGGDR
jgi:hypothetical protein